MGVNLDKMKKKHAESQRSGEFWGIDEGEHKVYVHPPCRDDDEHEPTAGLPYIELTVHYQVGRDKSMVVCLDPEKNPILNHPFLKEFLKKRKIKLTGSCPVCEGMEDMGELDADECRAQTRYLWGLTPLYTRRDSREDYRDISPRPGISLAGKTIYDGIMGVFGELGNITDFNGAMLVKISRKGKRKNDTKYKVEVDIDSARAPMKLPKAMRRAILKALEKGGDCDLFKVVGNLCRGPKEVEALMSGVSVEKDEEPDDDGVKPCFGIDYADDPECAECEDVEKCQAAMKGVEVDEEGEDDEDGDDDYYDAVEGDDDEDGDDDYYGEDEGEEAEEEDDEGEEADDDDGLDELEAQLKEASKRKRSSTTVKASAKKSSSKTSKAASKKSSSKTSKASAKKTSKSSSKASSKKGGPMSKTPSSKKGGRVRSRKRSK